jgi:hypothetical protein
MDGLDSPMEYSAIARRNVWIFDSVICKHSVDDIKYGSKNIKATKPLEDIGFVFYCLEQKDPTMNF